MARNPGSDGASRRPRPSPLGHWCCLAAAMLVTLVALASLTGHAAPAAAAGRAARPPKPVAGPPPEAVLVSFRPTLSHAARMNTVSRHGLKADLRGSSPYFARLMLPAKAPKKAAALEATLAALRRDPSVAYAEPDYWLQPLAVPNDPLFPELWALNNTGQVGAWPDRDVDAPEAWNLSTGSPSVVVAVIDTGVDYNHPDLAPNILRDGGGNVVGYDFYDDDPNPMDEEGHGTHCAGTIGAVGNNGVGVVGVCPTVKIMPIRFLGPGGGLTSDAVRAIDFARQNGARVMSNSWGGGPFSQSLLEAVRRARDGGILFVAAAGNSGTDNDVIPHYPSNYNQDSSNVISVAASTPSDHLSEFSCFGAVTVDIAAPGRNILSTIPGNQYARFSGTSMATPHVSGAAALLLSNNPSLTVQQLKGQLLNTTDDVPQLAGKLRIPGRLNVSRALGITTPAPPAATGPDVFEPDNTPATATPHVSGRFRTHTFHTAGDVDWIQFTAPAGAIGAAFTYDLAGGADTVVELFGANGTVFIAGDDNGYGGGASYLPLNLSAGGVYHLRVRDAGGNGGAGATYTLEISWAVASPDAFEPDNVPADARAAAAGQVAAHTFHVPGDVDWVRFTVPAGVLATLETLELSGGTDTVLDLYDATGTTRIGGDDDGGGGLASFLDIHLPTAGTYLARISEWGNAGGAGYAYQFRVSWVVPQPDAYEPDNTAAAGHAAQSGQTETHTFHVPQDPDWVKVDVLPGARVVAVTSNLVGGTDTVLDLYDANGTSRLASDDDGGGGLSSRIDRTIQIGGTYFLRVTEVDGIGGPGWGYQLTVTVSGGSSDQEPPAVFNTLANPTQLSFAGGNVTLSATAIDNSAISAVRAEVTPQGGTTQNVSLTRQNGSPSNGTWSGVFAAPANSTETRRQYTVTFVATDAAGNVGSVPNGAQFSVDGRDVTAPTVATPQATPPSLPPAGGAVTLSITAADAAGVASAEAEVTRPDNSKSSVALTRTGGTATSGTWTGTFTAPANTLTTQQSYRASFFARDGTGNRGGPAGPVTVTVAAGGPPDIQKPVLTLPTVSPKSLVAGGGNVTVTVTAADNKGVATVRADVTKPGNTKASVTLTLSSGNATKGTYKGTFAVPANATTLLQTYKVQFFARDGAGNEASSILVSFTVAKGTPPRGKLVLSAASLNFGSVPINTAVKRSFEVSNGGPGTLKGMVGTLVAPYSVVIGGGAYTLAPGAKKTVEVQFRPTVRRSSPPFNGSLRITSDDPTKLNATVSVTGTSK